MFVFSYSIVLFAWRKFKLLVEEVEKAIYSDMEERFIDKIDADIRSLEGNCYDFNELHFIFLFFLLQIDIIWVEF